MALAESLNQEAEILELHNHPFESIPEIEAAREAENTVNRHVPLMYLNTLSQHRNGRNSRQEELKESIRAKGMLINAINITSLDGDTLSEYIQFTNRLWGGQHDLSEYVPYAPDRYLVVIAGHSRKEACDDIATEDGIPKDEFPVYSRVHIIDSIEEFLSLQVDENIHSSPPPDRAARAYAEAFIWQSEHSTAPLTKAQFAKKHGISNGALNDMLHYADLPPEIRVLTDNGQLPFTVSVELGRALPWLTKDAEERLQKSEQSSDDIPALVNELVTHELMRYISLFNGRFNRHITNTRSLIRHDVKEIKKRFTPDPEEETFEMALFDASTVDNRMAILDREIRRALHEVHDKRGLGVRSLHNLIAQLMEVSGVKIDTDTEDMLVQLGSTVLSAATSRNLFEDA